MLWFIFGVMLLAALCAVVWPLYRTERRFSARASGVAIAVAALSAVLYVQIGQPEAQFAAPEGAPESVEDMVSSLAARLEESPEDVEGWKMLGRSYTVMGRFDAAIEALERAVQLENSSNGQTLAELGEAIFLNDNSELNGRAGPLFENALALVPGNPKALFYSGLAAADRGDNPLAAERWEALLATSPPENIEAIIRQRIAEWRGEAAPAQTAAAATTAAVSLDIEIALGEAAGALDPRTTVFIIARDPAQPAPPVAVDRRLVEELPTTVTLSDAQAMLPGRPLSGFARLEIEARASPSGQPRAQSGDWFGEAVIDIGDGTSVSILMDQQVP